MNSGVICVVRVFMITPQAEENKKYRFIVTLCKNDMDTANPPRAAMPAVNLRHIEIFHAVMTTGNLTEAARLLHTSQPTVSRELARFEKVIGLNCLSAPAGVCSRRCRVAAV
jgi:molybdenum-dependent DNA-binding transcriptional regulator ModE